MRIRLLILLIAIAFSVAACGGGGGGGSSSTEGNLFDTTTAETGSTEITPPPPAPPAQAVIVIRVAKGEPIGPQSSAEQVAQVQKALVALGYKIGKADGVYGGKTRKAVVNFQKKHKLTADGLVGQRTATVMNQALAKLASGSSG